MQGLVVNRAVLEAERKGTDHPEVTGDTVRSWRHDV